MREIHALQQDNDDLHQRQQQLDNHIRRYIRIDISESAPSTKTATISCDWVLIGKAIQTGRRGQHGIGTTTRFVCALCTLFMIQAVFSGSMFAITCAPHNLVLSPYVACAASLLYAPAYSQRQCRRDVRACKRGHVKRQRVLRMRARVNENKQGRRTGGSERTWVLSGVFGLLFKKGLFMTSCIRVIDLILIVSFGYYCDGIGSPTILCAVLSRAVIAMLLIRAGIEVNPGPSPPTSAPPSGSTVSQLVGRFEARASTSSVTGRPPVQQNTERVVTLCAAREHNRYPNRADSASDGVIAASTGPSVGVTSTRGNAMPATAQRQEPFTTPLTANHYRVDDDAIRTDNANSDPVVVRKTSSNRSGSARSGKSGGHATCSNCGYKRTGPNYCGRCKQSMQKIGSEDYNTAISSNENNPTLLPIGRNNESGRAEPARSAGSANESRASQQSRSGSGGSQNSRSEGSSHDEPRRVADPARKNERNKAPEGSEGVNNMNNVVDNRKNERNKSSEVEPREEELRNKNQTASQYPAKPELSKQVVNGSYRYKGGLFEQKFSTLGCPAEREPNFEPGHRARRRLF